MKLNRKNFLKIAGIAAAGMVVKTGRAGTDTPYSKNHVQKFNMYGYAAPKLDKVRVGFIGIGTQGSGTVARFARVEGVEIKALCDIYPERINKAVERIPNKHIPEAYSGSEDA